jgi:hypothetical protein
MPPELLRVILMAARHPLAVRLMRAGAAALDRLPYRRLICLDTEFRARGDPHRGWCLCAVDLRSGDSWRIWLDDYSNELPFPVDRDTLFIAFVAGAEIATYLARRWPFPVRVFDLFQEFRLITNTGLKSDPHSLEAACAHFHISTIAHAAKKALQTEAAERLDWPEEKKRELIAYCWEDTLSTARLFLVTLALWLELHQGDPYRALYFALQRGEVAGALAAAELRGIPFARDWYALESSREAIFCAMVEDLHPDLRPIYRGGKHGDPTFTMSMFREVMAKLDQKNGTRRLDDWPLTERGDLSTTDETLHMMLSGDSNLEFLAEVMKVRSKSALLQCEVGQDMRARAPFFPGSTTTGRGAPSSKRFIFAAPKMFRHVVQARSGRVVISFDYAAQESAVMGELAGDLNFMAAYYAGDVHLECARRCDMVSPDMDAKALKQVRKEFKVCNLAVVYQAGFQRIAAQLGRSEAEARRYMATHRGEFWKLHAFVEAAIAQAMHEGVVIMQDGWRRALPAPFSRAAAANAPAQGTAAAIYRQAVLGVHRAGLPLIATVHDSFVFECAIPEAPDLIPTVTRIMVEAGAYFLPGLRLKVDVATSVPLPALPHLVERLADPGLLETYLRHLGRARKALAA